MRADAGARRALAEIVERLVAACRPKRVILFGSYAYGEPTADSDVDVLLITDRRLSPEETYRLRRKSLAGLSAPVQLVCMSEEEFAETKDIVGGIAYPAAKYGEVLYEGP